MFGRSNAVSGVPQQQTYPRTVVAKLLRGLAEVEAEVNATHDLLDELAAAGRLIVDNGEGHGFVYHVPQEFVDQLSSVLDRLDAWQEQHDEDEQ